MILREEQNARPGYHPPFRDLAAGVDAPPAADSTWAAFIDPPPPGLIPDAESHAESLRELAGYKGFRRHPLVVGWLRELADLLTTHARETGQ